ncbi:MAG: 16S rRNA (uracil(1498)-N(3))-methyltransferase [Spirochaetes bacterium]|nr:16S rRNA (uracil(1498)-N(3))-methyltransferase [Spirochaetota bacterium]
MNLLIINPDDIEAGKAVIRDKKRISHITDVLKKTSPGDSIKAGILNAECGTAEIISIANDEMTVLFKPDSEPPTPLPLKLVIAVPRPKVFRRILQQGTALGIKEFHFMRTWKTDKSYLLSPELSEKKIYRDLIIGLEQAKDTILPDVFIHPLFKPFAEDELPEISDNTVKITAHPGGEEFSSDSTESAYTLAIGPEGGFTPYEIELLEKTGFSTVHLGSRILRVETALPYIAGRLFR